MATFDDYPPDEFHVDPHLDRLHIDAAVAEARTNLGYVRFLIESGAPKQLTDLWTDKLYDTLRARLTRQQLLQVVVDLLWSAAADTAADLWRGAEAGDLEKWAAAWARQGYGSPTRQDGAR